MLDNSSISLYRFRKELIAALVASGWQVTASAPNDGLLDNLEKPGLTFIDTPVDRHGANPVRDYALLRRYKRLMRETRPDAVLTYTIKPNIYGNLAAEKFGLPVISMVTGLGETFINGGLVSRIVRPLCRAAFRKTARILFLNREDMEIMRGARLVSGQEYLLASGEGVNLDEFPAMDYPTGPVVSFLYLGRVMRSKGIGQLIEAARRLKVEYPDKFSVTLIGYHEGDIVEEVERAALEGVVRYAGFQKDIKFFLRNAHCVVLPSYYKEGLPVSLLEAAACARPLIASDISGCREVVDDGVNGYLCRVRDAESLYGCLKRFLEISDERRAEMGESSRRKVEAEFDRREVVSKVADLLFKIL